MEAQLHHVRRVDFQMKKSALSLVIALQAFGSGQVAQGAGALTIPRELTAVLDTHCFSCHDGDSAKGDIRLDNLAGLPLADRLALLNKMHEQLYLGKMPPKKRKELKLTNYSRQSKNQMLLIALIHLFLQAYLVEVFRGLDMVILK